MRKREPVHWPKRPRWLSFGFQTLAAAFLGLFIAGYAAADAPKELEGFDAYVEESRQAWEIPGLAISIVRDGELVLSKGYGVRALGEPAPVDEDTLFAIGSCTKAFTAAAVAMLVDEDKLDWNDPVRKHLPDFELYDPYVTREITVLDLLCHRTGIVHGNELWYGTPFDRNEIVRRLRYLEPSTGFRSGFGYHNVMYLVAGEVVGAVWGNSWDDFIAERIFKPLGMTRSNTSVTKLEGQKNVASPHAKVEGRIRTVRYRNIDNVAPPGSINSNVADMANWIRLMLGQGVFKNERLLSSGAMKQLHASHNNIHDDGKMALILPVQPNFTAYGLGWYLTDYEGRKMVWHGGGIDGMMSSVCLIPEEGLGVVVLSNLGPSLLANALMYDVMDRLLGVEEKNWSAKFLERFRTVEEKQKEIEEKQKEKRVNGTSPSLELEEYAGTYEHKAYGAVAVRLEEGRLVMERGPEIIGRLEHWHYDTFQFQPRPIDPTAQKMLIAFTLNADGEVKEVDAPLMGTSITFERVLGKVDKIAAFELGEADLKKFVGVYESDTLPMDLNVEWVGGKLKAVLPGRPAVTLLPVSPTRFGLEGAPEQLKMAIEFKVEQGKIVSVVMEQAGMALTLTPKPKP